MYSAMIFSVEPERSRLRRSVRSAMAWGLRARIKEGWRRTMGFWCWWEIDREAGYIAAYPAGLGREASCWLAGLAQSVRTYPCTKSRSRKPKRIRVHHRRAAIRASPRLYIPYWTVFLSLSRSTSALRVPGIKYFRLFGWIGTPGVGAR
jgi:hypothetical protein